ncbi:MAG: hypothetical protein OXG53_02175 [Chloroflexi bacterium]|nr:hypothetical protein [Chloroflexota bacterium]
MSNGRYGLLKETMDEIVAVAANYDPPLRPVVVECLSMALIADSSGVSSGVPHRPEANEAETGANATDSTEVTNWDFRGELLQLNECYDLSRKKFKDPEFPALIALVIKRHAPIDQKSQPITKEHLENGCRTVDRPIPSQPAATLSTATSQGFLDKVKGQSGYTLTPKGESRVNEILAAQDDS